MDWTYNAAVNSGLLGTTQSVTAVIYDQWGSQDSVLISFAIPGGGNSLPDVSTPITAYNFVNSGLNFEDITNYYVDLEGDPLTADPDPMETYVGVTFLGGSFFALDTDNSAFQYLTLGQTETFIYTYLVSDGTGSATATIEWTLEGTRDGIYGTTGADALVGNDFVSELINGGADSDTLTGGLGDDIFAFMTVTDGFDLITDYTQFEDHIGVSAAAFGGNLVAGGTVQTFDDLDHTTFNSGGTDGVFILETDGISDGILYWDADGGSGANAIALAQLTGITSLTADDFFVFL